MKNYSRGKSSMDNLYDEMRIMRDQLLNRIELLEDEVEYLTQENMYYSKQIYQLESDIDSLLARIQRQSTNEGLEH
jgi:predicted  nucleic acid-binding Zn-ribbon protein